MDVKIPLTGDSEVIQQREDSVAESLCCEEDVQGCLRCSSFYEESAPEQAPEQSQPSLSVCSVFFKSLTLMLLPQQMTADETALPTTD